jgi:hypothetical protein
MNDKQIQQAQEKSIESEKVQIAQEKSIESEKNK